MTSATVSLLGVTTRRTLEGGGLLLGPTRPTTTIGASGFASSAIGQVRYLVDFEKSISVTIYRIRLQFLVIQNNYKTQYGVTRSSRTVACATQHFQVQFVTKLTKFYLFSAEELPPTSQLKVIKQLIDYGVQNGKIHPEYILLGHRQVRDTACPGNALFNEIKTWPHWVAEPPNEDVMVENMNSGASSIVVK